MRRRSARLARHGTRPIHDLDDLVLENLAGKLDLQGVRSLILGLDKETSARFLDEGKGAVSAGRSDLVVVRWDVFS